MWSRYRKNPDFEQGMPWLLRFFDQIKFYEVSETELMQMREDFKAGRLKLRVEDGVLNLKEYNDFLIENASIHFELLKRYNKRTLMHERHR